MTNILLITSSSAGEGSVSTGLAREYLDALSANAGPANIVRRDLGSDPIPHLTPEGLAGLGDPSVQSGRLAQDLTDEVFAADLIVIASPMYNFGITSTLKAWFDHVLRAGVTFRYTAEGPVGLVTGKRAVILEARGGLYSEGPAAGFDHQEPHLRTMLGFIGVTDVEVVRAERLAVGPEVKAEAIEGARERVRALAADELIAA